MDVEDKSDESSDDESSDSESSDEEEEPVVMPKLTKKIVDNFFIAPSSKVDEKSQVKLVGKDGKVLKTQPKYIKPLSDSDTSSDEDSDS